MADSSSSTQVVTRIPDALLVPQEAVAATNHKIPNSQIIGYDVGRENPRANSSDGPTDSGYVSAVTTPEKGTPENSVAGFSRPQEEFFLPPKLLRKPTKLTSFTQEVSKSILERFDDLAILFGEPLYKWISKGKNKRGPISMKCMVLGESQDSAKPWIVILCDDSVSKRVKKFFNQPWVKEECHPSDLKQPQFEYIIHNRAPTLIAGTSANVYGSINRQPHASMTSCGTLIQVGSDEGTRLATLGGIIKLQFNYGIQLLGLTAGHILLDDEDHWNSDNSLEDDNDEDDISEADSNETFPEETYELDLGSDNDQSQDNTKESGPSIVELNAALSAIPTKPGKLWQKVGNVFAKSKEPAGSRANSDWALVELSDMQLVKPNLLIYMDTDPARKITLGPREPMIPSVRMGLGRSVEVLTGTNGLRRGHLSRCSSYLMLARDKSVAQTYSLVMSDGLGLNPGDCGSWVVDKLTGEVYGHVVASDVFKEAYVIPLHATFQDIKQQLGLQKVLLPGQTELNEMSMFHDPDQIRPSQQPQVATSITAPAEFFQVAKIVTPTDRDIANGASLFDKAIDISGPPATSVANSVSKVERSYPLSDSQATPTTPTQAATANLGRWKKLQKVFGRAMPFRQRRSRSKAQVTQPEDLSHVVFLHSAPRPQYPPVSNSQLQVSEAPAWPLSGQQGRMAFHEESQQPTDSGYSSMNSSPSPVNLLSYNSSIVEATVAEERLELQGGSSPYERISELM